MARPERRHDLHLAALLFDLGPRAALRPHLERMRAKAPPTATGLLATIDRFLALAAAGI